jgi:hypothetical protein
VSFLSSRRTDSARIRRARFPPNATKVAYVKKSRHGWNRAANLTFALPIFKPRQSSADKRRAAIIF